MRIVEGLSGTVALDMALKLRFDYGTMPPWCEATERGFTAKIGPDEVSLDAPVAVTLDDEVATAGFTVLGDALPKAFLPSLEAAADFAGAALVLADVVFFAFVAITLILLARRA